MIISQQDTIPATDRMTPFTQERLYDAYRVVLSELAAFAGEYHISPILPAPVIPVFPCSERRLYRVTEQGDRHFVLPASNTYQKQVACQYLGPVYCVAACYRKEALIIGERRTDRMRVFHQIEIELPGVQLGECAGVALDLLEKLTAAFPETHKYDMSGHIVVDIANEAVVPDEHDFTKWCDERFRSCKSPVLVMHVPQMDPPHLNRDMGGAMLSEGFDIILPDGFGEVSSGGIRDKDALSLVYKDAPFSISHATTGGFGIGLERLVRFCLGAPWLQDVVLPHLWHDAI